MDRVRTRVHADNPHLVLVAGVLRDAAEEGEGERPLDVVVAVDRGRDAGDDPLTDTLVLGIIVRWDRKTREWRHENFR